jgi:GMP synthase-like glutamine amidotransferase
MGLQEYQVNFTEPWMDDARSFVIPASHYDQVVKAPPASRVIAASDFCRYAALSYTDRRAVSFQGHPEFSLEYVAMLIDRRLQKGVIDAAQAERYRASLDRSDDRARVIGWIRRFLPGLVG